MYCKNCGTQLSEEAKFCRKCGIRQGDANQNSKKNIIVQDFEIGLPKCIKERTKSNLIKVILSMTVLTICVILLFGAIREGNRRDVTICERIIDKTLEEKDYELNQAVKSVIKEEMYNIFPIEYENIDGIVNSCAVELVDSFRSGRSQVKYDVVFQDSDIIKINASVKNADVEEAIEDLVVEVGSTVITDRNAIIKMAIECVFCLTEVDWEESPDELAKVFAKKLGSVISESISKTEKEMASGTFIFENIDGEWTLQGGEDLDGFWEVYNGINFEDEEEYYDEEYYDEYYDY